MAYNPNLFDWRRETIFIPVTDFLGIGETPTMTVIGEAGGLAADAAFGLADDADDAALAKVSAGNKTGLTGVQPSRSAGTGNMVLAEIGTTGLVGLVGKGSNATVRHVIEIPSDLDRDHPVRMYARWTCEETAVTGRVWALLTTIGAISTTDIARALSGGLLIGTLVGSSSLFMVPTGVAETLERDVLFSTGTQNPLLSEKALSKTRVQLATQAEFTHLLLSLFSSSLTGFVDGNAYLLGLELEYTKCMGRGNNPREAYAWEAA